MSKIGCACQSCDSPTNWPFTKYQPSSSQPEKQICAPEPFKSSSVSCEMRAVNRRGVRRFNRRPAAADGFPGGIVKVIRVFRHGAAVLRNFCKLPAPILHRHVARGGRGNEHVRLVATGIAVAHADDFARAFDAEIILFCATGTTRPCASSAETVNTATSPPSALMVLRSGAS